MNALQTLARPDIVELQAYPHAAWLPHLVRLHANEAPWRPAGDGSAMGLNRYPEPQPDSLVQRLADVFAVNPAHLLLTRGSDDAIDVLSRVFLRAGEDSILQCTPTFGMYQVAARIQGAGVVNLPLARDAGFRVDPDQVITAWRPNIKLVYLCSPNNPTAALIDASSLHRICSALDGKAVVVIDEAYIEWSGVASFAGCLGSYQTLAILRTLSKAHALAGARCGALIGNAALIELARPVIPPYAIAQPTVDAAMTALQPGALLAARERLAGLLLEREYLAQGLARSRGVERVWPSDTNFLMIDCTGPQDILDQAIAGGFIVRDLRGNPQLPKSLRITVGTREHNNRLLDSLERN